MDRKKFLKKGMLGLGTIIAVPSLITSCDKEEMDNISPSACAPSPSETDGPFPIKTPADWVRENIIGDRTGVPLVINFTIQNTNNDCAPLPDVLVDIWHCDSKGNYSEYDGQIEGDFTTEHFLRGRQTTDGNGNVSFISVYPGWYPGRAPHLHVEVKSISGSSLLITQVAFPEDISNTVYAAEGYNGNFDTSNSNDGEFSNSLARNMADSVAGNTTDGYVLTKVIKVAG
ncbi:MAG: intradiol ring-cleavage dioxygenase [Chitinophagales bacterium]|nr:intradiol ring-cleavage dioxygenase [Chitinophagales bacterium]